MTQLNYIITLLYVLAVIGCGLLVGLSVIILALLKKESK